MTAAPAVFNDSLATHAPPELQRLAARLAEEAFALTFRLSADSSAGTPLGEIEARCHQWTAEGADEEARALRLAMLVAGLDQWGLAYSQAFGLTAIPALSTLLGALRNRLDARAEGRFQWFFAQIEENEADAIDFKVDLRRQIHLALWHAMSACEDSAAATPILRTLGSLLLALNERMPTLGWRLIADALAHFQIRLLSRSDSSEAAQQGTQQIFDALRHTLPPERHAEVLAHATQVVLAWQQAQRQRAENTA